jgi:hypothetical protein
MPTMTSYEIIKEMVDNDGIYPGDPQVEAIWEYSNDGQTVWCVIIVPQDKMAMHSSPYVKDPQLLWSQDAGLVHEPTRPGEKRRL